VPHPESYSSSLTLVDFVQAAAAADATAPAVAAAAAAVAAAAAAAAAARVQHQHQAPSTKHQEGRVDIDILAHTQAAAAKVQHQHQRQAPSTKHQEGAWRYPRAHPGAANVQFPRDIFDILYGLWCFRTGHAKKRPKTQDAIKKSGGGGAGEKKCPFLFFLYRAFNMNCFPIFVCL
jgi:hypothetical protein